MYEQLKVGAGVLIEHEGGLLLLQRGPDSVAFPGAWNLPSGYCEADEPPKLAAAREALEETGLEVKVDRLADVYFFDDDPRGNGLLLVYEAEVLGGVLRQDDREVVALDFFQPEQLPVPLCGGGHDQAIAAWQARAQDRWQPGALLRYCPHCTHPLAERLAFGRVRLACSACGFVHFREPKVGVSVVAEQDGQLLLVQRAVEPGLGQWALPSGFVEWNESPEEAAIRECREETGLEISIIELADVRHYTDDFRGPGVNLIYRARVAGGKLQPGDDAAVAQFFAPAEIPVAADIAFQGHSRQIEQWRASN